MAIPETLARKKLQVTGVVQGVGFRPFIYRLARLHRLAGWVCNTSQCVEIEIEGPPASLATFIGQLATGGPGPGPDRRGGEPAPPRSRAAKALPSGRAGTWPPPQALIPAGRGHL